MSRTNSSTSSSGPSIGRPGPWNWKYSGSDASGVAAGRRRRAGSATSAGDGRDGPDVPPEAGNRQVDDRSGCRGRGARRRPRTARRRRRPRPTRSEATFSSSSGSRTNMCSCISVDAELAGIDRAEERLDRGHPARRPPPPGVRARPSGSAATARSGASPAGLGLDPRCSRMAHRRGVGAERPPERRDAARRARQLRDDPGNQEWPCPAGRRRPSTIMSRAWNCGSATMSAMLLIRLTGISRAREGARPRHRRSASSSTRRSPRRAPRHGAPAPWLVHSARSSARSSRPIDAGTGP